MTREQAKTAAVTVALSLLAEGKPIEATSGLFTAGANWQAEQDAAALNSLADGIKERDERLATAEAALRACLEALDAIAWGPPDDSARWAENTRAAIAQARAALLAV